jgi:hypothetical protein
MGTTLPYYVVTAIMTFCFSKSSGTIEVATETMYFVYTSRKVSRNRYRRISICVCVCVCVYTYISFHFISDSTERFKQLQAYRKLHLLLSLLLLLFLFFRRYHLSVGRLAIKFLYLYFPRAPPARQFIPLLLLPSA